MEKRKYKKTHPFSIIKKLKISVFLVLLSIIQQFLYRPRDIFEYVTALGFNAVYAIAAIAYAVYSYTRYRYKLIENGIQIHEGLFIKRRFTVPYSKIQTIVFNLDALAAVFGAVKVSFDTPAGLSKSYDISAHFSRRSTKRILIKIHDMNPETSCVKANFTSTLLMCAFWSNPAAGLLFIAPVISKLGDVAGNELANNIWRTQSDFRLRLIALNIPPATAGAASVLIMGWIVSLLLCFMRYGGFKTYNQGEYIVISKGLVNKNITFTKRACLSAITVEQGLLMHLMGIYTSGIFTIGSGKLKGDRSIIIAPEHKKTFFSSLQKLLKISPKEKMSVRTAKNTMPAYLYLPFFITAVTVLVIMLADNFSIINDLFKALLLFLLIPLFWWMLFRVFAHEHSHLGITSKYLVVCGFKRLTLKTYYIPFDKIQCVKITQSIPQRMAGTCNIQVYLYFENRALHTVKHIPLDKAKTLLSNKKIHFF